MARYLIVVPPFWGHINPTLGIGREMIRRGHEVLWVGLKDIPKEYIPLGGKFVVPHEVIEFQEEIDKILSLQNEGTKVVGDKLFEWSFEGTWIPFCRFLVPGLLRTLNEFKPDLLISDEDMKAGAICAFLHKIPYVISIAPPPGLYCSGILAPEIESWIQKRMLLLQEEYGISQQQLIFNSSDLNLIYSSKLFITNLLFEKLPQYQFVGPIVESRFDDTTFDWERFNSSSNKKIYVSIGTVLKQFQQQFYAKIVEAFKDQDFTIVAAVDPNLFASWPSNFIVQSYCPQSDIIPKVDIVITHGGFNTVNETLYHGKPLIVIPLAFDQVSNGYMVENAGCGIKLRFKRLTSLQLRESVISIINDRRVKDNLLVIEESMKQLGGSVKAVDLVEAL